MHNVDHSKNIIELKDVFFRYGQGPIVLHDITLNVHRGDYLGIIGPNGGGKTTLLKIMLGLLKPTSGTVKLFGQDIHDFHDWYKIAYVPQKVSTFDTKFPVTVEEVVMMGTYARRGLWKMSTAADRKKVDEALKKVDMHEFRRQLVGDLSGGQQQRVFIARTLAADPEVVFLDEPTVGVDPDNEQQFFQLLKKLNNEFHLTLVLVSHELDVVARESTEVACINSTLTSYLTPDEITNRGGIAKVYEQELQYMQRPHHPNR